MMVLVDKPTNLVQVWWQCLKGLSQRMIETLAVFLWSPHVCSPYMPLAHIHVVYRHTPFTQRELEAHSGYVGETLSKTK